MSELKVASCFEFEKVLSGRSNKLFYSKSEADKVIAEKDKEIEKQKQLRNMALASVPNVLKVMKIIQHHKYKRCLSMARICLELSPRTAFLKYDKKSDLFINFYDWWYKRWLELAEKFKPNNQTAQ